MTRNAAYDYTRLLAAIGIVFFHAHAPGGQIGYAALPFFLMLMLVLALPAASNQTFGQYAKTRWNRLMIPWFLWSAIYGALKLVEVLLTSTTLSAEFSPHMLVTGPALHLWFLPFAWVVCLAIFPLAQAKGAQARVILPLALVLGAVILQALRQGQTFTPPLAQWTYVAPAACLAMALVLRQGHILSQVILTAVFISVCYVLGWHNGLPQLALASSALLACSVVHLPRTWASDLAAGSAMGVYLVHPLIFSVLDRTTSLEKNTLPFALISAFLACIWAAGWPAMKSRLSGRTV